MTLGEALEPLYRAYLRRLDEMAARVPREARLTETTTRGDDGRVVRGDDGLPLRFDVANGATGETFDVHGSSKDEPLAAEVVCGSLSVRLSPANWEELPVAAVFEGAPGEEDAASLAKLFASFGELAAFGAFATRGGDWRGRVHAVRSIALRDGELCAVYDLGTAPPSAVEALVLAIGGFAEDHAPIAHVRIGSP